MIIATRYFCPYSGVPGGGVYHTAGDGKPRRARCAGCGAALHTARGSYGAFHWVASGQYPAADAVREFRSAAAADKFVKASGSTTLVVRWIAATAIYA